MDTNTNDTYDKNDKYYKEFNDQLVLYNNNYYLNGDNNDIINNVHNLTECEEKNMEELYENIKNIMTTEKIIKELLYFDLFYYKNGNTKISDIDGAVELCIKILKKFQYKVGGYEIEDIEWIVGDSECKRFLVGNNQRILYNSIHKKDYNNNLVIFIRAILNYIENYLNKNLDIKYYVYEDDKNSIYWIIYRISENEIK